MFNGRFKSKVFHQVVDEKEVACCKDGGNEKSDHKACTDYQRKIFLLLLSEKLCHHRRASHQKADNGSQDRIEKTGSDRNSGQIIRTCVTCHRCIDKGNACRRYLSDQDRYHH